MRYSKFSSSRGASLIEASLFIIISGFFLVGLLGIIPVIVKQVALQEQDSREDIVRSALFSFITRDADDDPATPGTLARYPCPAPFNAPPDSLSYGVEQRDEATGACLGTPDGSNGIFDVAGAYIGAVPTVSLRIPSVNMRDTYENRFTYAVSKDLVRDNALNDPTLTGSITVRRESGAVIPDAPFVLISHGEQGTGAYSAAGGLANPCNETTVDAENCAHDDAVFVEAELSTGTDSAFYDDRMAFTLVDEEDTEYWAPVAGSISDITNKNPGIICVGQSCNPSAAVPGDIVLASGNVHATVNVQADQDVIGTRDILAGRDLSALRGLIVGGVSDPENLDNIGTGSLVAGTGNVAVPTGSGDIVAENELRAGANIVAAEGYLKPGAASDTVCDATLLGAIRYNNVDKVEEYCAANGGGEGVPDWVPFVIYQNCEGFLHGEIFTEESCPGGQNGEVTKECDDGDIIEISNTCETSIPRYQCPKTDYSQNLPVSQFGCFSSCLGQLQDSPTCQSTGNVGGTTTCLPTETVPCEEITGTICKLYSPTFGAVFEPIPCVDLLEGPSGGGGDSSSGGGGSEIPAGAVMAFNRDSCPSGWSSLSGAAGRFIVGVGSADGQSYARGDSGGEAQHILTIEELPVHNHTLNQAFAGFNNDTIGSGGFGSVSGYTSAGAFSDGQNTNFSGDGTPHENRPPYLAFLYCQKD